MNYCGREAADGSGRTGPAQGKPPSRHEGPGSKATRRERCPLRSAHGRVSQKWRREWDSRTHETVARLHAFQACAFNHSAISPEQKTPCGAAHRDQHRRRWARHSESEKEAVFRTFYRIDDSRNRELEVSAWASRSRVPSSSPTVAHSRSKTDRAGVSARS